MFVHLFICFYLFYCVSLLFVGQGSGFLHANAPSYDLFVARKRWLQRCEKHVANIITIITIIIIIVSIITIIIIIIIIIIY